MTNYFQGSYEVNVTKLFIGLNESIFNLSLSGLNVGIVLVQIESYNTLLTVDHNSFMTNWIVSYFLPLSEMERQISLSNDTISSRLDVIEQH